MALRAKLRLDAAPLKFGGVFWQRPPRPLRPAPPWAGRLPSLPLAAWFTPVPYYLFEWDPPTIEHLAEHDVTPEEFEQVVNGRESQWGVSRQSGRPLCRGYTDDGRYLICILQWGGQSKNQVQPITAYEPDPR